MHTLPPGWIRIAPHTVAKITLRGDVLTGLVLCRVGAEWVMGAARVSVSAMEARVKRAASRLPEVARKILAIGEAIEIDDQPFDPHQGYEWIHEIGASKAERMARRARKRRERRARVARRFKNTVKKIARGLAKLKILDRLRKIGRSLLRSKLLSKALSGGLTALGTAFGGPAGAMLGSGLARGLLGSQLDAGTKPAGVLPPSAYAMGCGCGGGRA